LQLFSENPNLYYNSCFSNLNPVPKFPKRILKCTQIQYKYCYKRNDVYAVIWSYRLLHYLCCRANRICMHDLGEE
jgi:hypothetical protein